MLLLLFSERSQRIHEESLRNIQRLEEGGVKRRRYALPEEEEEMQVRIDLSLHFFFLYFIIDSFSAYVEWFRSIPNSLFVSLAGWFAGHCGSSVCGWGRVCG